MQRQDLLAENGAIFAEQGKSIDKYAKKSAKIIVVGNPCNTNCLIALKNAPSIDPKNFFAMTRLDQNRAQSMLANRLGCTLSDISDLIIWGNHSSTQVVDLVNVKVKGGPLTHLEKVGNLAGSVKERGAEIIKMRGKSSAASAAMALIDTIQDLAGLQPKKLTFSVASHSNKNPYNVAEDIIFSFPTIISQPHQIEIDGRFKVTAELEKELKETEAELLKERDMVKHLI